MKGNSQPLPLGMQPRGHFPHYSEANQRGKQPGERKALQKPGKYRDTDALTIPANF